MCIDQNRWALIQKRQHTPEFPPFCIAEARRKKSNLKDLVLADGDCGFRGSADK